MTTRTFGQVGFSSDIEVAHTGPFDARLVTPLKSELTGMAFAYKGMVVAVTGDGSNNGLYRLTETDKTVASNWVLVGSNVTVSDLYTLLGVDESSSDENYLRKDGTFASPTVDLSSYATTASLASYATTQSLGSYSTTSQMNTALATKLNLTGGQLSGNLGIGVAASEKLHVQGSVMVKNSLKTHFPNNLSAFTEVNFQGLFGCASQNLTIQSRGNNAGEGLFFQNKNGTQAPISTACILMSGEFGIGTTAPAHKLDVAGSINYTGTLYKNGNNILSNYATTASLSSYATTSSVTTTLADYATTSSVNTTLADYATTSSVSTTLADYATTSSVSTTLADYATTSSVTTAISNASPTIETTIIDGNTNAVTSNAIYDALAGKQDSLTFDAPSSNTSNPSTSAQIKTALDDKLDSSGGTMTGNLILDQKSLLLDQVQTNNRKGIYWHAPSGSPNTGYGIYRESGDWTNPNYPPLRVQFNTGLVLSGGTNAGFNNAYVRIVGKCGVNVSSKPSHQFEVNGDVNITSGNNYHIDGTALQRPHFLIFAEETHGMKLNENSNTGIQMSFGNGDLGYGLTLPCKCRLKRWSMSFEVQQKVVVAILKQTGAVTAMHTTGSQRNVFIGQNSGTKSRGSSGEVWQLTNTYYTANTEYQDFDPTWPGIGGPLENNPDFHPLVTYYKWINMNNTNSNFYNNVPSDSALGDATNTTLDFNAGDRIGLKTTRLVDPTTEQNNSGCRITLLFEYLSDT